MLCLLHRYLRILSPPVPCRGWQMDWFPVRNRLGEFPEKMISYWSTEIVALMFLDEDFTWRKWSVFISLHGVSTMRAAVLIDSAACSSSLHSLGDRGVVTSPTKINSTVTVYGIDFLSTSWLSALAAFAWFVFLEYNGNARATALADAKTSFRSQTIYKFQKQRQWFSLNNVLHDN